MANFRLIFRLSQVSEFSHAASVDSVCAAGYLQEQGQIIESMKKRKSGKKDTLEQKNATCKYLGTFEQNEKSNKYSTLDSSTLSLSIIGNRNLTLYQLNKRFSR